MEVTMSTTTEMVLEIVSNHTKVTPAEITPATLLENLAIDSLGMVEIIFELEEQFDIEIPESGTIAERFKKFKTPADIIAAVDELVLQKK
jgi:acyl carrier protein